MKKKKMNRSLRPVRVTSSAQPGKEFVCISPVELARVLSGLIFGLDGESETRIEDMDAGVVWVINVRKEAV